MLEEEQTKIEQLEAEAVQHEKNAAIIRASMSSKPSPDDYEQLARIQSELDLARVRLAEANYIRKMAGQREARSK